MLHAVNMGDSGFMLIRQGVAIYKSPIQQHYFNCPYQLGNSANSNKPWQSQVNCLCLVLLSEVYNLFNYLSHAGNQA